MLCSVDMIQDLRNKTNADERTKKDLTAGIDATDRVIHLVNAALGRGLRAEALEELRTGVGDWKRLQIKQFGDLLIHGVFVIAVGKSNNEKEVCNHY